MKTHLIALFILAALAACSPKVDQKGYIKLGDLKEGVVIGQTSKQEVMDKFGSPSSQSSFGEETWYYIQNRKETVGFMKPEVVDQDVTRITFDDKGIVAKIEGYNQDNATEIKSSSRETPTEGHSLGFFEQIMGNVGRFNKSGSDSAAPGRKPSSY